MIWLLGTLVLACNPTVQKSQEIIDQTQPAPEDTAFVLALEEEEEISLSAIETALQEGIEEIRTVRANRVLTTYQELLAQASAECPRWYSGDDGPYWADDCQTNNGVSFQGFGIFFELTESTDESGNTWTGSQLHCEGHIESSAKKLSCVGGLNELTGADANGSPVFYSYTSPYVLEDDDGLTSYPQIKMWAVNHPDYKAIHYSGTANTERSIIQFDEMTLANVICPLEPSGSQNIQVSGLSSSWINLLWHGGENDAPQLCDGCADAFLNGESIGSVCADFSIWLQWENSPFE